MRSCSRCAMWANGAPGLLFPFPRSRSSTRRSFFLEGRTFSLKWLARGFDARLTRGVAATFSPYKGYVGVALVEANSSLVTDPVVIFKINGDFQPIRERGRVAIFSSKQIQCLGSWRSFPPYQTHVPSSAWVLICGLWVSR